MRIFRGHRDTLNTVAYSPDGTLLASGGKDHTARVWDLASGVERVVLEEILIDNWIYDILFTPDGSRLVTAGRRAAVWDVASGALLATLGDRPAPISCRPLCLTSFPATGRVVLGWDWTWPAGPGTVTVWDPESGTHEQLFGRHETRIYCVRFSPDGAWMAMSCAKKYARGGMVRVWKVSTGSLHCELDHGEYWVLSLRFLPDNTLVTVSGKNVYLWDVRVGTQFAKLAGHRYQVNALAVTPDGKRILSGSNDHTVCVWDAATGRPLGSADWGVRQVHCIAVSPDGMTAAAVGMTRKVVVWDLDAH